MPDHYFRRKGTDMQTKPIKFYDVNLGFSKHSVKVTFMDGDLKHSRVVKISGNCKGFSIIDSAQERAIEEIINEIENGKDFVLKNDKGNCSSWDDSSFGSDAMDIQLQKLIVSVEIVEVIAEKR